MNSPNNVLVTVKNLKKSYISRRSFVESLRSDKQQYIHAVRGVSFEVRTGEIFGLIGQSGCGKSTLGLLLTLLERPTAGQIIVEGEDIAHLKGKALKAFRKKVQIVFQDPYESLNPQYRAETTVAEPLVIHQIGQSKVEQREIVRQTFELVGLRPAEKYLRKYPHELSGGERQRVAIARAIVLNPTFLVADEAVSMLDVSVRAGVLNLMLKLKEELRMTYLFITHDLSVARYMCDKLAIMYFGNIIELGPTDMVLHNPVHPYTQHLINAVPNPDPALERTSLVETFTPEMYRDSAPDLVEVEPGHLVASH